MGARVGSNSKVTHVSDHMSWTTSSRSHTNALVDVQDVAKMALAALRSDASVNKTLTLLVQRTELRQSNN